MEQLVKNMSRDELEKLLIYFIGRLIESEDIAYQPAIPEEDITAYIYCKHSGDHIIDETTE